MGLVSGTSRNSFSSRKAADEFATVLHSTATTHQRFPSRGHVLQYFPFFLYALQHLPFLLTVSLPPLPPPCNLHRLDGPQQIATRKHELRTFAC
jgi:hypothetical protein